MSTILILGSGYTGKRIETLLRKEGHAVRRTQRSPAERETIRFNLSVKETWNGLPPVDATVWTFPAEPTSVVAAFAEERLRDCGRLIVLGTTSSYRVENDGEVVTEQTPLRQDVERVRGEETLQRGGAIILRSAGIYGPGRNPLDWIRSGLVKDSRKLVNLIHVDDLAQSVMAAMGRGKGSYIVSDGTPRSWRDIIDWAMTNGFLDTRPIAAESPAPSRRLVNAKLLAELAPRLSHADLWQELARLEVNS